MISLHSLSLIFEVSYFFSFLMSFSFQIYNEQISDLLDPIQRNLQVYI